MRKNWSGRVRGTETSLKATVIIEKLLRSWPTGVKTNREGQIKNKAYLNWQQTRYGIIGKRECQDQFQSFLLKNNV